MTRLLLYATVTGLLLFSSAFSEVLAQTTLLDVKDGATPLFHVNDDGSLVSLGAFGAGVIPATGAGVRLMWYPAKGALRAGEVTSTQWDEANVGPYSVALGRNTVASGGKSMALGASTTASGNYAMATGIFTTASNSSSTAMGYSTTASGYASTALGNFTLAGGSRSTALGDSTTADGFSSTAMGFQTQAGDFASTAMGRGSMAIGYISTALGDHTTASGPRSTALGDNTTASGDYATAMGIGTTASLESSTAMGDHTTANGASSTAMGKGATARGNYSTAMGVETYARAYASLVLGRYNVVAGDHDTWASTDPVLVVGNGDGGLSRSNAFTLLKDGNLTIAGTLTENSDRRLKTDIRPLSETVPALRRLQAVRFRFRAGTNRPEGEHIGLIAQDVQAVFPELVQQGADGYLSVSYTNLTAVLVQALSEQQDEIEALTERVARLEALLLSTQAETASRDEP
jgi:hypothetical protein